MAAMIESQQPRNILATSSHRGGNLLTLFNMLSAWSLALNNEDNGAPRATLKTMEVCSHTLC